MCGAAAGVMTCVMMAGLMIIIIIIMRMIQFFVITLLTQLTNMAVTAAALEQKINTSNK